MATQKDIELAERFVAALELELDEISRRLNRPTPEIFTENVKWNQAVRALIAHAKNTVPADPQPGNIPGIPDSSSGNPSETPKGSLPAHNPATAEDYNTMHDYFGK
jgi:hypothetical protein